MFCVEMTKDPLPAHAPAALTKLIFPAVHPLLDELQTEKKVNLFPPVSAAIPETPLWPVAGCIAAGNPLRVTVVLLPVHE